MIRPDPVGFHIIYKQWLQLNEDKKVKQNKNLPEAIIVDIDGTCAHMGDRRKPFEWDKVDQDTPDEEIFHIIKDNFNRGREIIFLSGRDSICRDKTFYWLTCNMLNYVDSKNDPECVAYRSLKGEGPYIDNFKLYMRKEGDIRSDDIVKEELFNEHIRDVYNIKLVLDDRPKLIKLWHSLGLKVLACADPFIEF